MAKLLSLHDYVIKQLQNCKGEWPAVAEKTQIPKRTLEKIARQEIADPGVKTVQKLADYFHRATSKK